MRLESADFERILLSSQRVLESLGRIGPLASFYREASRRAGGGGKANF